MALAFLGGSARKRDQIVAIDLGEFSAKAVHMQRRGERFSLLSYAIVESGSREAGAAREPLEQRLRKVSDALGGRCKQVVLAVGCADSILRTAELPLVPLHDMRTMLRLSSKTYLQQELADYTYDCYVLPPRAGTKYEAPKAGQKVRVLVGGTRTQLVTDSAAGARAAGLIPEGVVPELICPVNALEVAQPDLFAKEAVALVDLGHRSSSICVLSSGELVLSRVVAIGGERVTSGLAESLGTSHAEAEGIKMGLAHEVQSTMAGILSPLGRELRASMDYFEHQQDRTVSQVLVSGAAARSEHILQVLQAELMVPCAAWNPAAGLVAALAPQQAEGLDAAAAQLAVAVGAALSMF